MTFPSLSLVLPHLRGNLRRTVLTASSMAVALCLLAILGAASQALLQGPGSTPAAALRLMIHHKVSITQPIPISFQARVQKIPGVDDVMVWQWFGGTFRDARDRRNSFARFAVEPAKLFRIRSEIQLLSGDREEFSRQRTACIVDRPLADRFGWEVGDRVTLVGNIFPVTLQLTIAGIYRDPNGSSALYFNYEYLRGLLKASNLGGDAVGVLQARVSSPDLATAVADAIDKEFENSPAPTTTETERSWQLSFIAFLGDLRLFFISISCGLVFTILLVSANTVSMAIREQIGEVGILKTLGFSVRHITAALVAEAALIAITGGAIGLALAGMLCIAIRNSGTAYAALNLTVTPLIMVSGFGFSAALGVASSLLPAWRAARLGIVQALKYSG